GMTVGGRQPLPFPELASAEVKEPVLARLKTLEHGMPRRSEVCARMLARRIITTTDMAAKGTAPQVQPPAWRGPGQALRAPRPARRDARINVVGGVLHQLPFHSRVLRR